MKLSPNTKLVMIGDSITDTGRARPVGEGLGEALGKGYVAQVDALLTAAYPDYRIRVVNMGISGNTVRDLANRWQSDVLNLEPDWLSIMIGTNDVWRQFDSPLRPEIAVQPEEYETTYRKILTDVRPQLKGLVLMTPFYIEPNRDDAMRARMDQYGAMVKKLAPEFDALFVDTQAAFDDLLKHVYPATIAWDRVHPSTTGHITLARSFLNAVGFEWKR